MIGKNQKEPWSKRNLVLSVMEWGKIWGSKAEANFLELEDKAELTRPMLGENQQPHWPMSLRLDHSCRKKDDMAASTEILQKQSGHVSYI